MPSMIRRKESVRKHLMYVRRHMRLCRRLHSTHKFIHGIRSFYREVQEKNRMYLDASGKKSLARDAMTLRNRQLEDGVRTAYEKCRQHDRENVCKKVLRLIFPDGTFGKFVNNSVFKEYLIVEELVVRLEHLGRDHPLFSTAAYLKNLINDMEQSIEAFKETVHSENIAQVDLELAKENLRKQYEANYLFARKEFGRKAANKLFPYRSRKKKHQEKATEAETTRTVQIAQVA